MTLLALILVLGAACLHAVWNLAAKRVSSGLPFVFAVGLFMTAYYVPLVVGLIIWRDIQLTLPQIAVISVSTCLKTGYALFLQRAYGRGDFSLIYPIVRGSAPVLATIGAIIFLGERPTALSAAGGLLIVISIFFLSHGERLWQRSPSSPGPRLAPALFSALIAGSFIASYTVWDRNAMGYHHINPIVFDGFTNIGLTLLLAPFAWSQRTAVRQIWRQHRREVITMGTLAPLAYVLVLTALSFTPVSYVAPAREFSILIGAYLGVRFLKEPESPRRLWCALGMVIGLTTLALA